MALSKPKRPGVFSPSEHVQRTVRSSPGFLTRNIDPYHLDELVKVHEKESFPRKNPFRQRKSIRKARRLKAQTKTKLKVAKPRGPYATDYRLFEASKGKEQVKGRLYYYPKDKSILVGLILPKHTPLEDEPDIRDLHKKQKGKTMSPKFTRELLKKAMKIFPEAKRVVGERITGAHARGHKPFQTIKLATKRGLKVLGPIGNILSAASMIGTTRQQRRQEALESIGMSKPLTREVGRHRETFRKMRFRSNANPGS